jgi:predicted ferric reductase
MTNRLATKFDRLEQMLNSLEHLDRVGRYDAIINEVIETNGWFGAPKNMPSAPQGLIQITLHGVTAYGACASEACANWLTAAKFTRKENMGVSGCVS